MPIPEPSAELGLWPKVKAISGWPEPDEDRVKQLATGWRGGQTRFTEAGGHDLAPVRAAWTDSAGGAFDTRASKTLTGATEVGGKMGGLAVRADNFATEVTGVKTGITDLIETNLGRYALVQTLPQPVRGLFEEYYASVLGGQARTLINAAAARTAQGKPPPPLPDPSGGGRGRAIKELIEWLLEPDNQRLIGDGLSWLSRQLDNPADAVAKAGTELLGAGLSGLGELTGNDQLKALGATGTAVADWVGERAGDAVLEGGSIARNGLYELAEAQDGKELPTEIYLSRDRHPEALQHVNEARSGTIWEGSTSKPGTPLPDVLHVDRTEPAAERKRIADARRRESTGPIPPYRAADGERPKDRDEYPPAMTYEGGRQHPWVPSVKHIDASDNRSAGSTLSKQVQGLDDRSPVVIRETD
ncbi:NucA/NucB deoxyribonuclease domain-containing protein [Crossiella sp. CA-258035]|uniref:WXG100-like domain-containing protein n=1 Tax=Crossiella sp. CA-258035 TaxID=2981138 RepID=UPI0024BC7D24|nr:NucA/NucB deoxyribonuclease domain-containing protein [Crossiella sp. CA-258035]WHT16535.1 NucA/NucB deoxyribonuclease domain-containing protein [Crossiella sp. CA-258035]